MAIDHSIDTDVMARRFVEAVRGMPAARELRFRVWRGVAEFWLITEPTDFDTETSFYALSQLLYDRFPGTPINFEVINPAVFAPFDLVTIVPDDAARIILHA